MSAGRVTAAMANALLRVQSSSEWMSTLDPEERAWAAVLALCEALHPLGEVSVPARHQAERLAENALRDEVIYREFNGRNFAEIAAKHSLSARQVRRIVKRQRQLSRRATT